MKIMLEWLAVLGVIGVLFFFCFIYFCFIVLLAIIPFGIVLWNELIGKYKLVFEKNKDFEITNVEEEK